MASSATSRIPNGAYLALPADGAGPGVLVLHAWWGLNDTFRAVCDRLAEAGFVVLAPDLYGGKVVTTIDEAEGLATAAFHDSAGTLAMLEEGLTALRDHPAARGDGVGVVGFSMGGYGALRLATGHPADVAAVVIFYGTGEGDFGQARATFLGHFALGDEFEPDEQVRQLEEAIRDAGREVTFHRYHGVGHWFFEPDRPEHDPAAASVAWERTLIFLHNHLA